MAFFAVEERKIAQINVHPNADKLELGKLEGIDFQFCVKKGEYQAGDKVVYFPIDSVIPEDLAVHLGVKAFLAGKNHDRVKTVRLRGSISQGLVTTKDIVLAYMEPRGITYNPETLTADLGITKYEPPSIPEKCARLLPLRGCLYTYDIEGCDRFPAIVEKLKADKVYITEKLEGTNFGISITTEGDHLVNQRNYIVDPIPSEGLHFFHEIVQREHLFEILHEIKNKYWPTAWVTLRGEVVGEGVQGNHYGLKGRTVYFFDLEVNGQPIDSGDFFGVASEYMLKTAPVLARNVDLNEWLNGRTVQEASDGQSVLDPKKMREGIVIKPAKEGRDDEIGRLFLKQRGPKYLADTDN